MKEASEEDGATIDGATTGCLDIHEFAWRVKWKANQHQTGGNNSKVK